MNPWMNQPACDPFPTEGAATMSDRERIIDQMLEAGEVIHTWHEMRLRTRREMAEDMYDEVVAPLLAEAERRGAEKGWDEGHQVGWVHCQDGNYGTDHWDDDTPNPYGEAAR